jgi:CubicO group peptidase (beta-lactamase class C family)
VAIPGTLPANNNDYMRPYILLLSLFLFSCSKGQTQATDKLKKPISDLPIATLEKSGLVKDSIESLLRYINDTPPNDFRGLVVIKNNKLVIEEYFNTYWRNSIHDIRSAGKSVTALLLGIALKEGLVKSLDQDVYSFFPENKNPNVNKDYKKITLRHLLDMSSGLDADTDKLQTTGHEVNWIAKDNWKRLRNGCLIITIIDHMNLLVIGLRSIC